jgi:hypothetical protein
VAASFGSDANPCVAPNLPCKSINAAIAKAQPGDEIDVTGGDVYVSTDPMNVVHIDKTLTIEGGWNATFTARPFYTIVSGEHQRRGITIEPGADADLSQIAVVFGEAAQGGGLYVGGGLFGERLLIGENRALDGGGIFFNGRTGDEMFLADSALVGNLYFSRGGGLYVSGYRVFDPSSGTSNLAVLYNVTVSNNLSVNSIDEEHGTPPTDGGGVYVESGNLELHHATSAENTIWDGRRFTQDQAGIFADAASIVIVKNTLVADGCQTSGGLQFNSFGNNLDRGNTCFFNQGGDHINVNPLIFPPDVNAGPWVTITHALAPNSPAINTGDTGWCAPYDQRDIARPQGPQCDIGAFERAPTDPAMGFITHPGAGFAGGERCQPLEWNPTGRERPNPCRVDIDVLIRAALQRRFASPVTTPGTGR